MSLPACEFSVKEADGELYPACHGQGCMCRVIHMGEQGCWTLIVKHEHTQRPKPATWRWVTFSSSIKRKVQVDFAFRSKLTCLFVMEHTCPLASPYTLRSKFVWLRSIPSPTINLGAHQNRSPQCL